MAIRKKKGDVGEAAMYITRNRATKKLQLSIPAFRRLCILKGIYPREPKHRRRAQRGKSDIQQLFLKKDIIYLSHEPLIWKVRDHKIHNRKLHSLTTKRNWDQAKFRYNLQKPPFKLDHIVLERYPAFTKALQDLDDPLSTCSLYALLPNHNGTDQNLVHLCRKLTTEFMYFVIETRALRKAFISIKGYYYQAYVQGCTITWMVPHQFTPQPAEINDMQVLRWFVEFYSTMLGFVNYKLYQSFNFYYPPKLSLKEVSRLEHTSRKECVINTVEALSIPLNRNFMDVDEDGIGKPKKSSMKGYSRKDVRNQITLFKEKKFFLGRETNRESLTFIIRSAGGQVSWDSTVGPGSTYDESDNDIVYQIVDRPNIEKKHLTRYYVQPQWVYDSFNEGFLLPVQDYFVAVQLPAHLSPFVQHGPDDYTPPEKLHIMALKKQINLRYDFPLDIGTSNTINLKVQKLKKEFARKRKQMEEPDTPMMDTEEERREKGGGSTTENMNTEEDERGSTTENMNSEKEEHDAEDERGSTTENMNTEEDERGARKKRGAREESTQKRGGSTTQKKKATENKVEKSQNLLAKMKVKPGKPRIVDEISRKTNEQAEDIKMAESFIHSKQRMLYHGMLKKERRHQTQSEKLKEIRCQYETEMARRKQRKARNIKTLKVPKRFERQERRI